MTRSPVSDVNVKSGATSPSRTKRASLRAIGVVRVSEVGDRETLTLDDQRERIEIWCAREGHKLVDVLEEENVSGRSPLAKRTGLLPAVEAIEDGQADIVVVAYFDRLVRSLDVQAEVVRRVEDAGGALAALDIGQVSTGTSAQWLSSTLLGMVAEYHARSTGERVADAQRRSIRRGEPPFPNIPPGYRKREDGRLEWDENAAVVAEAFERRAGGSTIKEVRAFLRERGLERSFHGVQAMLSSRAYLGELHFGSFEPNLEAWKPLVDVETWTRCQKMQVPRGRRPKSERLLSRLGVLRCGTCGARMVIGSRTQNGKRYLFYRCPPVGDCPQRVTISAPMVEETVTDAVRDLVQGMRGTASLDTDAAARELEQAQSALENAIEAFDGVDPALANQRLRALQQARDAAQERLSDLRDVPGAVTVATTDDLLPDEWRALVRAVLERVEVAPANGKGDRLTILPR